jgi:hypothetical protein
MKVEDWLRAVTADAEARGLPLLKPLLESLAASTHRLREADVRLPGPSGVASTAEAARVTNTPERQR